MRTVRTATRRRVEFLASAVTMATPLLVALILTCCANRETAPSAIELEPIRVGWQVAWATQGQVALALQRTIALEALGLKGDFRSFTYGAPLSEAALAGQLDVAFVGDQPAVNLLSRSADWRIVARLMDFRVAIIVPPNSPIHSVADLKGKTIGIPFGASTHRVALQRLEDAGLDPVKDVNILNIEITEQSDIVRAAAGGMWPKVDAFASWDHHIAAYERSGLARVLESGNALGVVMMSELYLRRNTKDAIAFLAAYKLAYFYYVSHQDQVDAWFSNVAGGKLDPALLRAVAAVEPNARARTLADISVAITQDEQAMLQTAADFAVSQALIKSPVDIRGAIRSDLVEQADRLLASRPINLTAKPN